MSSRRNGRKYNERKPYKPKTEGNPQSNQPSRYDQGQVGAVGTAHRFRRGPILGYKRLQSLQTKSPNEIINELLNCKASFIEVISSNMKEDWVYLLVCALAEGCKSHMNENVNEILSLLKESSFLSQTLVEYILTLPYNESLTSEQLTTVLSSLTMFFKEWMGRLTASCSMIPIDQLFGAIQSIREKSSHADLDECLAEIADLLSIRETELRRKSERHKHHVKHDYPKPNEIERKPPNNFRDLTLEPSVSEITSGDVPFLRPNKTKGSYSDIDDYLDVQFRLLKEDFVCPLREGIKEIISKTSKDDRKYDLSIYEDVQIGSHVYTASGMAYTIHFRPLSKSSEFWMHSKQFLFGSFLCLSQDNFKSVTFATVANRKAEDLVRGRIDIRFLGEEGRVPQHNAATKFVLVESPAYFESYCHVLRRLQGIKPDTFPFTEYFIKCCPDVKAPVYLRDSQSPVVLDLKEALGITDKASSVNIEVLNEQSWPSEDHVSMNASQLQAVKSALTKEFVVIQGPPGTGKTYVGLGIVRALLDNRKVWDPNSTSCMLMVCYTNHALDQFLEGILEFLVNGVVRVGGRSKSEKLGGHNLHELVKSSESQRRAYKETKEYQEKLDCCQESIDDSYKSILSLNDLSDVMYINHKKQFNNRINEFRTRSLTPLEGWLGLTTTTYVTVDKGHGHPLNSKQEDDDSNNSIKDTIDVECDAYVIESQRYIGDVSYLPTPMNEKLRHDDPRKKKRYATLNKAQLDSLKGKNLKRMSQHQVFNVHDVWSLALAQRWALYLFWLGHFRAGKKDEVQKLVEEHQKACRRLAEVKRNEELNILSMATVIGMTTTGAAKYSALLEQIQPPIVVVEEAAEVLEAHIITSLTQGTQHLILIGDHKQLRPNPTCYSLTVDYKLDVSLFERMVEGGMKCETLTVQHRMRPEISRLLNHIYDNLSDHHTVYEYDDVLGINYNVYFINHSQPEDNNENNQRLKSYSNTHEAKYVVALCEYLLNQGYDPCKITILTMYTGQLITLRKLMPKERFEGVRVTAVDNFQGEENDIILMSLVRSNPKNSIGFLGIPNRVCVALSRAKAGFFCIGNFAMLAQKRELWKRIVEDMKQQNAIGESLELTCRNHPDRKVFAKSSEDFSACPEGGCLQRCGFRLACGHCCERVCHPVDISHEMYKCRKICPNQVCDVHETRCDDLCHYGKPCSSCDVKVDKIIPRCGHKVSIPCGQPEESYTCKEKCLVPFNCGHLCPGKCFEQCNPLDCKIQVIASLICGHEVTTDCCMVQSGSLDCQEPCDSLLECEHTCTGTCSSCHQGRAHVACKQPCQRILVCQHHCTEPCTKNCPPCSRKCESRCMHSRCPLDCRKACTPCKELCDWKCQKSCPNQYKCTRLCGEKCNRPPCDTPCKMRLRCKHTCIGVCGEPCPSLCLVCDRDKVTEIFFGTEDDDGARFIQLQDCEHVFEVSGMDQWMKENTTEAQNIILKFCPKCKTPIRRSFRYANIIKSKLTDIELVKKKIRGEERKSKAKVAQLLSKIPKLKRTLPSIYSHGHESSKEEASPTHDSLPYQTLTRWLNQRLTLTELSTIENQIQFMLDISSLRRKVYTELELPLKTSPADLDLELQRQKEASIEINATLSTLQQELMVFHISQQQLIDIRDELSRVGLMLKIRSIQCRLTKSSALVNAKDKSDLESVENQLINTGRLTEQQEKELIVKLNNIASKYALLPVTAKERQMIVKAMGFTTGHWFKCPNGHVYAIGDCGGANQEAKCPICNADIGGKNHKLAVGNKVATEMDGAQYPAWSEQNNMENFDPDELRRLQLE